MRAPSDSEHSESEGSESNASDDDDEEEEEAQPAANAYAALLQSFSARDTGSDEPRKKRRKIEHDHKPEQAAATDTDQLEDAEANATDREDEAEQGDSDNDQADGDDIKEQELEKAYEKHFANPDENELAPRLKRIAANQWSSHKLRTTSGSAKGFGILQVPSDEVQPPSRKVKSTRDVQLKARLVENAQKKVGDFDPVEQIGRAHV